MISPYTLLQETGFAQYTAMVKFKYDRENTSLGAEKLAEMVRAIPGSTRVSTVSLDKDQGIAIFNVKLISAKTPKAAFIAFKENALKRFKGLLLSVEIGAGTIETKGNFILNEEIQCRPQTNLGNYIGQLLEEGLLLEVSIEELRRQYVECNPPKLTAEVFEQIVQACNNKSNFATWLCKKVSSNLISVENLQLWSNVFEFFERYKQRFEKKDINQVKSTEDIDNFLADYNKIHDEVEAKKASGMTQKAKDETDQCILGHVKTSDGQQWTVYKTVPGQWGLERKIGSGTSWCTVADKGYFDRYMRQYNDPAYYIFINNKNPKEKYQLHYGSEQFMDKDNQPVDYSDDFVLEFFEYLKRVEGRKYSRKAERGLEQREQYKNRVAELDQINLQEELHKVSQRDVGRYTLYLNLVKNENVNKILVIAKLLNRDLKLENKKALKLAERLINGYSDGRRNSVIISKPNDFFDFVTTNYHDVLESIDPENFYASRTTLPKATPENREVYLEAASWIQAEVSPEFKCHTDKNLPSLESFKTKSSGNRTLYTIPEESKASSTRACIEAGLVMGIASTEHSGNFYIYKGPEIHNPANTSWITTNRGTLKGGYGFPGKETPEELDSWLDILNFIGLEATDRVKIWKDLGGSKGYKNYIKSQVSSVDWAPEGFLFGKVKGLLYSGNSEVSCLVSKDLDKGLVSWGTEPRLTSDFIQTSRLSSQAEIRSCGFPIDLINTFCQKNNLDLPRALESLMGRARGVTTVNVLRVLRDHRNQLSYKSVPYRDRYWVNATGLFGSWEQLGPAIKGSSQDYYYRISREIQEHPNCSTDVFLYYNQGNPRHTWNCIVRIIDQENKVVWIARRIGDGMTSWILSEIPEASRTDAGHPTPNYTLPQPAAPRQQRRNRDQQQPAAPAEAPNQNLGLLNAMRINCQNSDTAYRIPANELAQGLQSAGFVTLSDHVQNRQAVVYKAVAHRGQTQYVALIYGGNGHTLVAGYPQDHSLEAVEANSTVWRRLTQELDNSVHTFMQCHNVCQELHIPMPQAIQGWLVYRQGGQH